MPLCPTRLYFALKCRFGALLDNLYQNGVAWVNRGDYEGCFLTDFEQNGKLNKSKYLLNKIKKESQDFDSLFDNLKL